MDDAAMNLKVLTDHLLHLAEKHSHAAEKLIGANRSVSGTVESVSRTHGMACFATNGAVADAMTRRSNAGANLRKVSTELEEKLKAAATNYSNADYMAGKNVDGECRL